MADMDLTIDKEFQNLLPPLTTDERKQLEANLKRDGCRDALKVWGDIILDGMHRYPICTKLGIPFKVDRLDFADDDEAKQWMWDYQRGRRNMTPQQIRIFVGRRYNSEKKAPHRPSGNGQDDKGGKTFHLKTAERIAEQSGVDEKTVRNDAAYAESVDALAKPARDAIASGEVKATKAQVDELLEYDGPSQKQLVGEVMKGDAENLKAVLGEKTPRQTANEDPARRWCASLHKLYVFMNSTRDAGGIKKLSRKWSTEAKKDYIAELKRITGELDKWIDELEK